MQDKNRRDSQFSERLRRALKENGMKNKALAEKLGSDPVVISRYVTGKNLPDVSTLYQISKIVGRDMNWLMGDQEEPNRDVLYWQEKYYEAATELDKLRQALKAILGNLSN